ncbi:MAG: ChbG/HpnK family deacetylase [Bryobacterales bacterium]|nr:ChbG/HpnK family deacetylase [Bryobacterales bacterium]
MKRLIVNADDFGFTRDVNSGIIEAHTRGILTATTLMANGDAFDDAVRLANANSGLDVGVHFVLVGGRSLVTGNPLPKDVPALVRAVYSGQLNLYDELSAQADKIRSAGLAPLHADAHKHTHLLPPVCRALCAVAEEFHIPFVRRPADLPLAYRAPLQARLVNLLVRDRAIAMDLSGRRVTNYFAGFALTGRYNSKDLAELFTHLPEGVTELMTHPGHCTAELQAAPTRLKQSRAAELQALTAAETRAALETNHITLTRYRDI